MPEEIDLTAEDHEILEENIRKRVEAKKQQREHEATAKQEDDRNGAGKIKKSAKSQTTANPQ